MERVICKEMIHARGYEICQERQDMIIALDKRNRKKSFVYVLFTGNRNVNIKLVKEYFVLIQNEKITHCIIVYNGTITPTARSSLMAFDVHLELFSTDELQFNITKHQLVPKHERVQREKNIDYTKFPILKSTDPISRFYGYQIGDLIRITRKDGTIAFRVVR